MATYENNNNIKKQKKNKELTMSMTGQPEVMNTFSTPQAINTINAV